MTKADEERARGLLVHLELMRRARGIPPDGAPEEDKAMPETERQPRRELVAAAREHLRALQEIINELTQDDGGA